MPKKKIKSKVKKNSLKESTTKKKVKQIKKRVLKKIDEKELIIKTKPEWVKSALINKAKYQKNIQIQLKMTMRFGKKKEKEYLGLSHTKKLKMLNTAKKKLELNGMKMEL